ncbi:MAG: ethanolamine ammonia-lyase subunit EutC, partial [Pseudomonadota bacterium]
MTKDKMPSLIVQNTWADLRRFTDARIALGRAGMSQPTQAHLNFQLAHALARDAVHSALDFTQLANDINELGYQTLEVHSAAHNRAEYLQRPDLGRQLAAASCELLKEASHRQIFSDIVFVISDGLSASAVQSHAYPLLKQILPALKPDGFTVAPIILAHQGRVAIADQIAELLKGRLAIILVGERPGLSAPDSLGIYLTYDPRVGCNDSERNCISNIRPAGLGYKEAAYRLRYLIKESLLRQI